jgi:hypothetical protein
VTARIVAKLEGESPFERLAVGDLRLGLDPSSPPVRLRARDLGISGTEIALDRQRHLGSQAQGRVESRSEPLEQRQLRPIPDRIAGWIHSNRELQSDHGAVGTKKVDARIRHLATFESTDPGMGRPDRASDFRLAQTRRDPRDACVISDPAHCDPGPPSSSIGRAVSNGHVCGSCQSALYSGSTAAIRTPSVPTDGRRPLRRLQSAPQPLFRTPGVRNGAGGRRKEPDWAGRALVGTPSVRRATWASER